MVPFSLPPSLIPATQLTDLQHNSQIEELVLAGVKIIEINLERGTAAQPAKASTALTSGTEPLSEQASIAPSKRTKPLVQLYEE